MSTQAKAFFAVDTTIVPASFATQRHELKSWLPTLKTEEVLGGSEGASAIDSSDTAASEATVGTPDDEATAAVESTVAEQIEAALATQQAGFEAQLETRVQQAFDEGQASRDDELATLRESTQVALEQLLQGRKTLARAYRNEAVTLALTLAKAVIGHTLQVSEDALSAIVDRTLASIPTQGELVVRCHADNAQALEGILATSRTELGDPIVFRLVTSDSIEPGGLRIDFGAGTIDAQPSTALSVLEEAIRGALAGPMEVDSAFEDAPAALDTDISGEDA